MLAMEEQEKIKKKKINPKFNPFVMEDAFW